MSKTFLDYRSPSFFRRLNLLLSADWRVIRLVRTVPVPSQSNGSEMPPPSTRSLCFLTGSRFYNFSHSCTANMQVPLLPSRACFHTVPLVWNNLLFLSISIHYSFYVPHHRSVLPKESKGSYGKYTYMYLWYLWQINMHCKYHTAGLELPETPNQFTHTSFSSAFFFTTTTPLQLLVCSILCISSYFCVTFCACIYTYNYFC